MEDWEKAATFLEDGAKIVERIENTERYIGLYADAGFAQFKAGNIPDSIRLLHLALQKFEESPQDNANINYFTLKKRLAYAIRWVAEHQSENDPSEFVEPPVGFCSNTETNEKILTLPDFPMGYSWLYLAQIEYKFGHGTTVLDHASQITAQAGLPRIKFPPCHPLRYSMTLETKPLIICLNVCISWQRRLTQVQKHNQTGERNWRKGSLF